MRVPAPLLEHGELEVGIGLVVRRADMVGRARHLLQPGELVGRADQRVEPLLERRGGGGGGERDAERGDADGGTLDHRLRNSAPTAMVITVATRSSTIRPSTT